LANIVPAQRPQSLPADLFICGEAPGIDEDREKVPFVGVSGQLLDKLLQIANVDRRRCWVSNVFTTRPVNNDVTRFFVPSKDQPSPYPQVRYESHVYHLRKDFEPEITRLRDEIKESGATTVLALGNTALWALCGLSKISEYRGAVMPSTLVSEVKVVPSYHPAAVARDWKLRPILLADIKKASAETHIPGIKYPRRSVLIPTRLSDIYLFDKAHLSKATHVSMDVETSPADQQITCLSLATSPEVSFVIPIWTESGSFWLLEDELVIWQWLQEVARRDITFIFHNSVYDLTYLAQMGIRPRKVKDTMFMHFSYQPEWKKSLGLLGSLYANERSWKNMRVLPKSMVNKSDE
jgi:uracil-DNA glycosylase